MLCLRASLENHLPLFGRVSLANCQNVSPCQSLSDKRPFPGLTCGPFEGHFEQLSWFLNQQYA